jgi:hypothetical protein
MLHTVAEQLFYANWQLWRAFVQATAHRDTALAGTPTCRAEVTERRAQTTTARSISRRRKKSGKERMVAVGHPGDEKKGTHADR